VRYVWFMSLTCPCVRDTTYARMCVCATQATQHERDVRDREAAARHVERELRLQIERLQEDKKYNDQVRVRSLLNLLWCTVRLQMEHVTQILNLCNANCCGV
jgi:hypothetical protein